MRRPLLIAPITGALLLLAGACNKNELPPDAEICARYYEQMRAAYRQEHTSLSERLQHWWRPRARATEERTRERFLLSCATELNAPDARGARESMMRCTEWLATGASQCPRPTGG